MNYIDNAYIALLQCFFKTAKKFTNIALPIKQIYDFDFIAIENNKLKKIKVIHTKNLIKEDTYQANLRKSGGYNKNNTQKPFDKNKCDYVFIQTPTYCYLIPSNEIESTRALNINSDSKYRL